MTSSFAPLSTPFLGTPFYDQPGRANVAAKRYCNWVSQFFGRFTLEGLVRSQEPIALRDIYVPLRFSESPVDERDEESKLVAAGRDILDWLFERRVLLVSGLPGSGKTTLVRYLVSSLASHKSNEINRKLPDILPVPLLLRDYTIDDFNSLDDLIEEWMRRVQRETRGEFQPEHLKPYWEQGRYLLFLDGFDELGIPERRIKVNHWLREYSRVRVDKNQPLGLILATSRPSGLQEFPPTESDLLITVIQHIKNGQTVYQVQDPQLFGNVCHVVPFSQQQISQFCERWFALPTYTSQQQEAQVSDLLSAIRDKRRTDLGQLARRPSFLTMMAFVHATMGKLPDSRALLFDNLIEAYLHILEEWRKLVDKEALTGFPSWSRSDKSIILSQLGYIAQIGTIVRNTQDQAAGKQGDGERLFRWNRTELADKIRQIIAARQDSFNVAKPEHAERLVQYFLGRTGLLTEPQEGFIEFGHLSFQEYLAAVHLHAQASSSTDKVAFVRNNVWKRLDEEGWQEVATFFMAIDAMRTQKHGHAPLLAELNLSSRNQCLWLARLLGGREIAFGQDERKYWLAAVIAGSIIESLFGVAREIQREPENDRLFWDFFTAMCIPWQAEASPLQRLLEYLQADDSGSSISSSNTQELDELDELGNPITKKSTDSKARQFCLNFLEQQKNVRSKQSQLDYLHRIAELLAVESRPASLDLARAAPPADTMFRVESGNLQVNPEYWGFLSFTQLWHPGFTKTFVDRSHLAMHLSFPELDTWASYSVETSWPRTAGIVRQAISVVLANIVCVEETFDLAQTWFQSRECVRDSIVTDYDLSVFLYSERYHAFRWAVQMVADTDYIPTLFRDRITRMESSTRFGEWANSLVQMPEQAWRLLEKQFRIQREHLCFPLRRLLFLFACAAEAKLLSPTPDAPVTQNDVMQSLDVLSEPSWIQHEDPNEQKRLVREFRECQELGLFPTAILEAALKRNDVWLQQAMTPQQLLEKAAHNLIAWAEAQET